MTRSSSARRTTTASRRWSRRSPRTTASPRIASSPPTAVRARTSSPSRRSPGPATRCLIEQPGYDPLIGACRLMRRDRAAFRAPVRGRLRDRFRTARARDHAADTAHHRHEPAQPVGHRARRREPRGPGAAWRIAPARWCSSTRSTSTPPCSPRAGRRRQRASPVSVAPFIVTNSLTKSYGLAGLRNGWIVAPDAAIAERMRRTRDVDRQRQQRARRIDSRGSPSPSCRGWPSARARSSRATSASARDVLRACTPRSSWRTRRRRPSCFRA